MWPRSYDARLFPACLQYGIERVTPCSVLYRKSWGFDVCWWYWVTQYMQPTTAGLTTSIVPILFLMKSWSDWRDRNIYIYESRDEEIVASFSAHFLWAPSPFTTLLLTYLQGSYLFFLLKSRWDWGENKFTPAMYREKNMAASLSAHLLVTPLFLLLIILLINLLSLPASFSYRYLQAEWKRRLWHRLCPSRRWYPVGRVEQLNCIHIAWAESSLLFTFISMGAESGLGP